MNNLPWFPLDAKQWLVGTAGMTKAEKGVFIDLLCYQWENGSLSSIPNRLPIECADEWATLQSKFTEITSGELVNPKLHKIRLEKESILDKQVEGGKKGARSRYGSPSGKAIGIKSKSQSKSQEPEKDNKEEEPLTDYEQKIETYFSTKIDRGMLVAWHNAHPSLSVDTEILKAKAWLFANQDRKQYTRFGRFLGNWMSNATNPPPWMKEEESLTERHKRWREENESTTTD